MIFHLFNFHNFRHITTHQITMYTISEMSLFISRVRTSVENRVKNCYKLTASLSDAFTDYDVDAIVQERKI